MATNHGYHLLSDKKTFEEIQQENNNRCKDDDHNDDNNGDESNNVAWRKYNNTGDKKDGGSRKNDDWGSWETVKDKKDDQCWNNSKEGWKYGTGGSTWKEPAKKDPWEESSQRWQNYHRQAWPDPWHDSTANEQKKQKVGFVDDDDNPWAGLR